MIKLEDLILSLDSIDTITGDPAEMEQIGINLGRLAAYADNKALAMRHRILGSITAAAKYEKRCALIYETLPAEWQW